MGSDKAPKKSRYMRPQEVADELGYSKTHVYTLLAPKGPIAVVQPIEGGDLRVVRSSFEDYCARIEREASQRFSHIA